MATHAFANGQVSACVAPTGAELHSLKDRTGTDYLWPAGPAWPRHAPVLFPIVGRLRDDTLLHDGRGYRMTQHGFARDMQFSWLDRSAGGCTLLLTDDDRTRAIYPFAFRFEIAYALVQSTLNVTYAVTNTGGTVLPAAMGAHPAFRWPLQPGLAKQDYALIFGEDEPAPIRRVAGGLLTAAEHASPVDGRRLALREDLFADDAIIMPAPASRRVRFAAASGPALGVAWDGFAQLGVWSRPGADFLCIEPWRGMASPADFAGEFMQKPWLMLIPPGEKRVAWFGVTLEAT